MTIDKNAFRAAVRKFEPVESAIAKQWAVFDRNRESALELEAVPLDLPNDAVKPRPLQGGDIRPLIRESPMVSHIAANPNQLTGALEQLTRMRANSRPSLVRHN